MLPQIPLLPTTAPPAGAALAIAPETPDPALSAPPPEGPVRVLSFANVLASQTTVASVAVGAPQPDNDAPGEDAPEEGKEIAVEADTPDDQAPRVVTTSEYAPPQGDAAGTENAPDAPVLAARESHTSNVLNATHPKAAPLTTSPQVETPARVVGTPLNRDEAGVDQTLSAPIASRQQISTHAARGSDPTQGANQPPVAAVPTQKDAPVLASPLRPILTARGEPSSAADLPTARTADARGGVPPSLPTAASDDTPRKAGTAALPLPQAPTARLQSAPAALASTPPVAAPSPTVAEAPLTLPAAPTASAVPRAAAPILSQRAEITPKAAPERPLSSGVPTLGRVLSAELHDARDPASPAPLPPRPQTIAGVTPNGPPIPWQPAIPDVTEGPSTKDALGLDPLTGEPRLSLNAPNAPTQALPQRADLPPTLARQLAEVIQQQPNRPVEISLKPQELGAVRLSIQQAESGIIVSLSAERPETLDLMRRNIDQLGQDFQAMGYANIAFSFAGGDTTRDEQADQTTPTGADPEDIAPLPATRIHLAAGTTSGVDLRL